jgi:hypothetical protein
MYRITSKVYWDHVTNYFNEMNNSLDTRSSSSLWHRWADIHKKTSRFSGFYAEIEKNKHSGKSEDDKVRLQTKKWCPIFMYLAPLIILNVHMSMMC